MDEVVPTSERLRTHRTRNARRNYVKSEKSLSQIVGSRLEPLRSSADAQPCNNMRRRTQALLCSQSQNNAEYQRVEYIGRKNTKSDRTPEVGKRGLLMLNSTFRLSSFHWHWNGRKSQRAHHPALSRTSLNPILEPRWSRWFNMGCPSPGVILDGLDRVSRRQ